MIAPCSMPTMPISIPTITSVTRRLRTNTVSNTAFRGFGGPQGMVFAEAHDGAIAALHTGIDPLDVRKQNLYSRGRDETPYRAED